MASKKYGTFVYNVKIEKEHLLSASFTRKAFVDLNGPEMAKWSGIFLKEQ
jgi:hypothetical protein